MPQRLKVAGCRLLVSWAQKETEEFLERKREFLGKEFFAKSQKKEKRI